MNPYSQSLFSQSQQAKWLPSTKSPLQRKLAAAPVNQSRIASSFPTTSQSDELISEELPSQRYRAISSASASHPIPITDPEGNQMNLRSIAELPERYRSIFSFPYFNIVQSKIMDSVMYSDDPVVLCAPTGSGKTVLFEMAIIRLLSNNEKRRTLLKNIKIIYLAPIKALCSERFEDWKTKFERFGMICKELTGDSDSDDLYSLKDASLIFTTPEKWDSMTRRWRDNKSFIKQIRLFMIDEVHLLNDETRGATVEAVVSRMKLVIAHLHQRDNSLLRIVAVSATMANFGDIAEWLGSQKKPSVAFMMNDKYRPVELERVVYGYRCNNGSNFKFDYSLNYRLVEIIRKYSNDRPTLIFVSTRKGTQQSAAMINKDAKLSLSANSRQKLQRAAMAVRDSTLKECLVNGIGFHNAGLDYSERKTVEELFTNGDLLVLVSTSTLAMGVNLPAHLVIIKSTQHYTSNGFTEYSESEILQMIGRAGRPQFDTSATAVIMTKESHKEKYEKLVGGKQVIESSLHKNLIEHLNAEIVLGTIPRISVALDWLKATFLYVRIMKNPLYYGLKGYQTQGSIEAYLQQLCVRQLNLLEDIGMITSDHSGDRNIVSTESGKLMARYCISYGTMSKIDQLTGQEAQEGLINFLANCEEFGDIQLRVSEKKVLNELNKNKSGVQIRYPMKGKIKTAAMKVSCLIQIELGCLPLSEFSLNQDISRVFRTASRITKCLVELYMNSEKADCLYNAILLNKCICAHLWENSGYITKQLPGIGIKSATLFTNAGIHTFSKLMDLHPRNIELICNRHPPFGNNVIGFIKHLPKYEMAIDQQVDTLETRKAVISLALRLANSENIAENSIAKHHCILLLIYDADNRVALNTRLYDATLLRAGVWTRTVTINRAVKGDELDICLLSLSWVGLDICSTFTPKYSGPAFDGYRRELQAQQHCAKKSSNILSKKVSKDQQTIPGMLSAVTTCSHKCHNKRTCGHTCCKALSPAHPANAGDGCERRNSNQPITAQQNRSCPPIACYPQSKMLMPIPSPGEARKCMSVKAQTQQQTISQSRDDDRLGYSQPNCSNSQKTTISNKLSKFQREAPKSCPATYGTQKMFNDIPKVNRTDTRQNMHGHLSANDRSYGDFSVVGDSLLLSELDIRPSDRLSKMESHEIDQYTDYQETDFQNSPPLSLTGYTQYDWQKPNGLPVQVSQQAKNAMISHPASYSQLSTADKNLHRSHQAKTRGLSQPAPGAPTHDHTNVELSLSHHISNREISRSRCGPLGYQNGHTFSQSVLICEPHDSMSVTERTRTISNSRPKTCEGFTSENDCFLPDNQIRDYQPFWDAIGDANRVKEQKAVDLKSSSHTGALTDRFFGASFNEFSEDEEISYSPLIGSQIPLVNQQLSHNLQVNEQSSPQSANQQPPHRSLDNTGYNTTSASDIPIEMCPLFQYSKGNRQLPHQSRNNQQLTRQPQNKHHLPHQFRGNQQLLQQFQDNQQLHHQFRDNQEPIQQFRENQQLLQQSQVSQQQSEQFSDGSGYSRSRISASNGHSAFEYADWLENKTLAESNVRTCRKPSVGLNSLSVAHPTISSKQNVHKSDHNGENKENSCPENWYAENVMSLPNLATEQAPRKKSVCFNLQTTEPCDKDTIIGVTTNRVGLSTFKWGKNTTEFKVASKANTPENIHLKEPLGDNTTTLRKSCSYDSASTETKTEFKTSRELMREMMSDSDMSAPMSLSTTADSSVPPENPLQTNHMPKNSFKTIQNQVALPGNPNKLPLANLPKVNQRQGHKRNSDNAQLIQTATNLTLPSIDNPSERSRSSDTSIVRDDGVVDSQRVTSNMLLIDRLGCTLSQQVRYQNVRSSNSNNYGLIPTINRNRVGESFIRNSYSRPESDVKSKRQANLQSDVVDRSPSTVTRKESIFGQTLKRGINKVNPTAAVKPMVQKGRSEKLLNDTKNDNINTSSSLAGRSVENNEALTGNSYCDGTATFDGLELLIQLKKRKKK